jgi:hypothetical protein
MSVDWHPNGQVLLSSSMDGTSRIWSDSGNTLMVIEGRATRFSSDGQWLGRPSGRWRYINSDEYRTVIQPRAKVTYKMGVTRTEVDTSEILYWEADPRGRLLIGQSLYQRFFIDAVSGETLGAFQSGPGGMRFTADGNDIICVAPGHGVNRIPVTRTETQDSIEYKLGSPEFLASTLPGLFAVGKHKAVVTPFLGVPTVFDRASGWKPIPLNLKLRPMMVAVDLSPDGRLLATGTVRGNNVEIHDTVEDKHVMTLPAGTANMWFHPDGHQLCVMEVGKVTFYETTDWSTQFEIQSTAGGIWPSSASYSQDGQVVAIEYGTSVRLYSTDTFQQLAAFPVHRNEMIESVRLTPGNRQLVIGTGDTGSTHLWQLDKLQARLTDLGLAWQMQIAPAQQSVEKSLRLILECDELLN